jgi:hypothetical protein
MVKHILHQIIFLYDNYVKIHLVNRVKEGFVVSGQFGCSLPSSINDFRISESVRSTGPFLDKKYTRNTSF